MSAVPQIAWTNTGPVAPLETNVLAGVLTDMNAAFGGNINTALETPQGQLASSQAAAIGAKNSEILFISAMFDPETSTGVWQDGLGLLYEIERIHAFSIVVDVVCGGLNGVVIPALSVVQDKDGNKYIAVTGGTIGVGGTVTLQFQCAVTGPIFCAIGAITTIYTSIAGWYSVTNLTAGELGRNVETRADFEARRKLSVGKNSINHLASVRGAVLSVPNIIDAYVTENVEGFVVYNGAVPLNPHSIAISVVGGTDSDVAAAIWSKKSPGCNYTGDTIVAVQDTNYSSPLPTYNVKFFRPSSVAIKFVINIANIPTLPANIITLIQSAVIAAFNGLDGGQKATIGSTLYSSRFYPPIIAVTSSPVEILQLLIGRDIPSQSSLKVNINEYPTIDASNIYVQLI